MDRLIFRVLGIILDRYVPRRVQWMIFVALVLSILGYMVLLRHLRP